MHALTHHLGLWYLFGCFCSFRYMPISLFPFVGYPSIAPGAGHRLDTSKRLAWRYTCHTHTTLLFLTLKLLVQRAAQDLAEKN